MDITGVPAMDATVANHLVQTVEAARLLGATVIVTGLSPEIAQTLVNIGVDLGKMTTVGDLQGGIEEAYGKVEGGEVWLIGSDIPEYSMGNRMNHKPKRPRKLLLHRREIGKFAGKAAQRGFTLVPLKMYFKDGRAKVELAVCRGKQLHDKRQVQKKADAQKEIRRALSDRRR